MRKKTLFSLGIIILLNMVPQLYLWNHTSDDAFITFRYVERLIDGKGLTFNDKERVEGFSNPLWVFLIALTSKFTGIEILTVAKLLGLLSSIIIFLFIYLISIKLLNGKEAFLIIICISACIFFTPGFHVYGTAGLEGPLLSMLLIATLYYSISKHKNHLFIASIFVGLVGILRPEGILYGILWLAFTLKFDNVNIISSSYLKRVFLVILPIFMYILFRLSYYGDILPNTAYAKTSGTYSNLFGVDDNFLYLITISLPLTILLLYFHFLNGGNQSKFFKSLAGLLLANAIFIIYSGGDWMLFGRFFLPIWPIILLTFFYLLIYFIRSISNNYFSFQYLTLLCLITIIMSQVLLFKHQWFEYNSNENYSNLMKGTDQHTVGKWLNKHIKPGSSVATFRIGGISYGAPNLIFYDTFGLTDKEEAMFRKSNSATYNILQNPIIKRNPDILAVINQNGYRMITIEPVHGLEQFLYSKYIFVKSFQQGIGVNFEIWIDKHKIDDILSL